MCTVLQQHLARMTNGYDTPTTGDGGGSSTLYGPRQPSPLRLAPQATYSYLGATLESTTGAAVMKRPIDPYDSRKKSAPAMHFHVPPNNPDGTRPSSRARSAYTQQLLGRSRSHSRTGMRVLVDELRTSTPRPRSPHMNNEEPINLSHYPDGRAPTTEDDEVDATTNGEVKKKKKRRKKLPIERDDFPAPPFPYTRRRHWSEPMRDVSSSDDEEETNEMVETLESSSSDNEDVADPKLDKTEAELKKISTGMANVFLSDLAVEREKRKMARSHRHIDPRSAARTPAANREPPFRLRYDSPVNASPSRVADHLRPWEDDLDGNASRRSFYSGTPFLPSTPGLVGRAVSPRPGSTTAKASTLPSRFSPTAGGGLVEKTYSTDFSSKSDLSDNEGGGKPVKMISSSYTTPVSVRASAATAHRHSSTERPVPVQQQNGSEQLNRSLPNMPPATDDDELYEEEEEYLVLPQAENVYPMHLLLTTNYRLPGDVDRCNLERHLTDADFEVAFRCVREDFYRMPYWKRCDLKRRNCLF